MALRKSELYSSLWAGCDELRGGMDASQYKDYVLVLLFIKYISDKFAGQPYAPIEVPKGASFADLVALKGRTDIGDQINKKIIAPLKQENRLADLPDFNDATKLGSGKEMVDRLTNLIAIFERPELNFSKNRAEGDDILGDAYEYLMRHFATESGKSKGQFYTPAEVSRVIAQLLGIRKASTGPDTSVYDPTCGSGSLLLKVVDEARTKVTLYGQEKDAATSGLARMNMILHDNATAVVLQGNTLADPKFTEGPGVLKTFDYVVANPPFSDKRWGTGLDAEHDPFGRFSTYGVPPAKQGDYAYLLHIVRSLKSTGRGACILPHGVLFRGNAEAVIRAQLVKHGLIQAIIGLPANLFYGTGIPACILVLDKAGAVSGRDIFMIDASRGFIKDGPKNRLRERDLHQIVDVFERRAEVPRYARKVTFEEIRQNDFNLNLPRYIDSQTPEDVQDIAGHLQGGIPQADIDALQPYWALCPTLRKTLFRPSRAGYVELAVAPAAIKATVHAHPEFVAFTGRMQAHFKTWLDQQSAGLKALKEDVHPKDFIATLADGLLAHYRDQPLVDPYAVYQHLMDYWAATLQDDVYMIAAEGWKAEVRQLVEVKKGKDGQAGKSVDRGWVNDLVPKALIVAHYFGKEQAAIDGLAVALEAASAALAEMEEEHGGEDAVFSGYDKINKAAVDERVKEIGREADTDAAEELAVLKRWLALAADEAKCKKKLKDAEAALDAAAKAKYPKLSTAEVRSLVVDEKWLAALRAAIHGEMERVSQRLTQRVKELAERYETPLPQLADRAAGLEARVKAHLLKMGFAWA
ncbi:type I restriction-modification system subunit M [Sphaerotilus sp.]|uniref:type I restriction-modification system subunit M n=1 Tax=Sphaerotilus sp. TaxID=2093942 RepID=UPI00286E9874|nr:type I restriction-modification system subunit M [Sphaerotilus sp.]